MDPRPAVYTIGYESLQPDEFLGAIRNHAIRAVVDIRSVAASRQPGFDGEALERSLQDSGIAYVHLPELGDFDEPADPPSGEALERVHGLAARGPILLLCKEATPAHCRRAELAAALARRGHPVTHLTPRGEIKAEWL